MYRVLLVDDEDIIVSGLKTLIDWEELGLEIPDSASSGEEALAIMERNPYDILVTDVRMPDMTGLEMIARIRGTDNPVKILVISGYDDFKYLKTAFSYGIENYLLKPVDEEELSATLLYTVEKIESERERLRIRQVMDFIILDNVLNSWVAPTQDNTALLEKLETFHIRLDRNYYFVCVIRVEHLERLGGTVSVNSRQVQGIFQQFCSPEESVYATFSLSGDLLLIYGGEDKPAPECIPTFFAIGIRLWLGDTAAKWTAGAGGTVENAMSLHESYQNAVGLMLYGSILPHSAIVVWELQQARCKALFQDLNLEPAWLDDFLHADEEQVLSKLDILNGRLQRLSDQSTEHQDSAFADILYQIFSGAQRMRNRNRKNEPADVDFGQIFHESNLSKKINRLDDLIIDFAEKIPFGNDNCHPLVLRVLQCIEKNYSQELSLKTLAAEYNVSQTYLGRIFKKDTDSLFTEHLCNYRIEKAKDLLLTTQTKSADIALQTGFSNPNYFSNVFKKRVGVYPTLFRQRYAQPKQP